VSLREQFTLIIPTYNRPRELARLLGYLTRHAAAFSILVLDSSNDENKALNAALVPGTSLDIRLIACDPSMGPWEKFWRGSEEVKTEFCSLCADDDIILPDALAPLTRFLRDHPDFSAAHGWYFSFYFTDHVGITACVYSSPSLDQDDPLLRLRDLFSRYEAITYGIYRAEAMRCALREVQPVESPMARELLGGALTVAMGKVARLPVFYYGRALGASHFYERWHPIDYMLTSPSQLFSEYSRYREILCKHLPEGRSGPKPSGDVSRLVDLIHMRYLSEYVKPEVMNYLIEEVLAGAARGDIMQGLWPRLHPAPSELVGSLRRSRLLRMVRDRLAPNLRLRHFSRWLGAAKDRTISAATFEGKARKYLLYREFLAWLEREDGPGSGAHLEGIIRAMNSYE